MNFQGLKNVDEADWYLDLAFSTAKKCASNVRSTLKGKSRLEKSRRIELEKINSIKKVLSRQFNGILTSFPTIDELPEFYNKLVKLTLEYDRLKIALGSLNWSVNNIERFSKEYATKIKKCKDVQKINDYRRSYYGRISSILKQMKKHLSYLEEARRIMKKYPAVKTELFTVCITGFPNVGKTTLLKKLTGANAEINDYAFTTKKLNIGYMKTPYGKIQFIDTPGTLNRFNKMNDIERQAQLAMKHCADIIVYVFDLTEPYPLEKQEELMGVIKKGKKDLWFYMSKADLLEGEIREYVNKRKLNAFSDAEKLGDEIVKTAKKSPKKIPED
ncbi:MAG: NOG1 family protein [Candidatus Nanoarchaeia archaeon]